jgi:VCBS repeat-containing protein
VLANDSDVDAGTVLTVTNAGTLAGSHGTLTLGADGAYAYQPDSAAAQSLGRNASVAEHFVVDASDCIDGANSTLDISVAGVNDAPILVMALADHDVTFNKAFSFTLPADSFKDIDQGDKLTYAATLADGSALPSWLKFDAATATFSGTSPKQVGKIDVLVTATDQAADGSTAGSLWASDVFTLAVSHGNEGRGNGEDAPPAGHDTNWNDGPGAGRQEVAGLARRAQRRRYQGAGAGERRLPGIDDRVRQLVAGGDRRRRAEGLRGPRQGHQEDQVRELPGQGINQAKGATRHFRPGPRWRSRPHAYNQMSDRP